MGTLLYFQIGVDVESSSRRDGTISCLHLLAIFCAGSVVNIPPAPFMYDSPKFVSSAMFWTCSSAATYAVMFREAGDFASTNLICEYKSHVDHTPSGQSLERIES